MQTVINERFEKLRDEKKVKSFLDDLMLATVRSAISMHSRSSRYWDRTSVDSLS